MKIEDEIKSSIPLENSKKIILNLLYTHNVLIENLNEVLKSYDLSGEQYNVLRILRGQKRNVCPENRRKIEVVITQKGLDILTDLDPKVKDHEYSFSNNLNSEELEQLNTLLEKYRNQ